MKKIKLSIPKPCHENWEAMTPSEKGKFCASCQKTVIDFTNMSDRQIADFFKKPPSSVCGRIYNDQLNRDIEIPKKRIPWVKYFFQFTWPALVLLLKSCGMKENSKGKINVQSEVSHSEKYPGSTLGMVLPEIMPVDTSAHLKKEEIINEEIITQGEIIEDIGVNQKIDSAKVPVDTVSDTEIVYKPMDTVVVVTYPSIACRSIMGAVSIIRSDTVQSKKEVPSLQELDFKAYPNPVKAGSSITISFEESHDFPEQIQILSSSGQLLSQVKQNEKEYANVTNIQIPSNIPAGVYFLRVITKKRMEKTVKIIVTK